LAGQRAVIRWSIAKPAPANRLADRAVIYPAIGLAVASATEPEEPASATGQAAESVQATALAAGKTV